MADSKQDKRDEAINILNNELAGIKISINTTNNSINAMKDTMDMHLKTITDSLDTRLKTFTDAMNTHLKIITAVLIVVVIFFMFATTSIVYQRPSPAPDKIYNNHHKSENTPSPTLTGMFQTMATGKGLKVATEGVIAIAYVKINGEDCWPPEQCVTCELVSGSTGQTTECWAQSTTTNQYRISYQANCQGRHQLHIKVEGEHIKGSPFTVTVIRKIGTPIKIIDKMAAPQGIAFSPRNEKIVAEYGEHQIAIFSPTLDSVERFGTGGKEDGQFNHPCGVAVDDDENILVADHKNNRIQKFNPQGQFIDITKVNGNHETHSLELGQPVGIEIHPHTKMIYVTDTKHHCIRILHSNLNFSSSFGSFGKGNGSFNQPKDVAFDSAGKVYVADNENHRIQVFTQTGQYLRKFGRLGKQEGELNYPSSISIDSDDVIYVTELHNNRVSMFTLQGEFLHSFGRKGNSEGEFKHPRGIKVDENGTIYVSDHGNDRIQVF